MRSRSFALIGLLLLAATAEAKLGVVFVHGKGGRNLQKYAEAYAYWGPDMIAAATKGVPTPPLICAYDGTETMWHAADVVSHQIYVWMIREEITDIVIHTHSFGGVVVRLILSNPWQDRSYGEIIRRIRRVNSIAPPNRGSEAANLAGTLSRPSLTGWLVDLAGQNTNSTKNCTTAAMARNNQYFLDGTRGRPRLPRPLFNIAGTGLLNDTIHSEDRGLWTLSGVAGLPGEDDGMVALYSAQAAGEAKFLTPANHHHNRRNDYRRIGRRLARDY